MPNIDELAPADVGEDRLVLTNASTATPKAFTPITIDVDYSACDPAGVVLPLEFTITAPSKSGFSRKLFTRTAPSSIIFTPREGGAHLVRLTEVGHQRWWGKLVVTVSGDRADPRRF